MHNNLGTPGILAYAVWFAVDVENAFSQQMVSSKNRIIKTKKDRTGFEMIGSLAQSRPFF